MSKHETSDPADAAIHGRGKAHLQAAIAECAQRFAQTRNIDDIMRDAVAVIADNIGFDRVGIFLFDQETRRWHGEFGTDQGGRLRDERTITIPSDPRHPMHRAERGEGEEFFVDDFESEFPADPFMQGVKNLLFVCLCAHGRLLGGISVDNLLSGRPIAEPARANLRHFARYIALALENLYLVQDLERKNAALAEELRQRQHAEKELSRIMRELERSNTDLEQFAYAASHDLQEPLRKIVSFGELMQQESVPEARSRHAARMIAAALRMQRMIRDLLAYSRVSRQPRENEAVDLHRLVDEIVSDLDARITSTGGGVEIGELPIVRAPPVAMRQLFQNLIDNALKFHREDVAPVVKVFSQTAPPTAADAPPLHRIVVEDNGIGIDPAHAGRIFGLFQRLHTRDQYEGTGIGLAVCRKIVERAGGGIAVERNPEHGTSFVIMLPDR